MWCRRKRWELLPELDKVLLYGDAITTNINAQDDGSDATYNRYNRQDAGDWQHDSSKCKDIRLQIRDSISKPDQLATTS